jgi:thioesterase domain-containing protein
MGFEAPGLYKDEESLRTTADFASLYVDELLADVGDGPFVLAGASFGAVVAHDMARRLDALGRTPELLVMFDCAVPGMELRRRFGLLRRVVGLVRRARDDGANDGLMMARIERTRVLSREARAQHRPGATRAPTLLFTSKVVRRSVGDQLLGWEPHLLGPVEAVHFDGNHLELIRDRAPETGRVLDARLVDLDRQVAPVT